MRQPIKIGQREFKYKKDALNHYKNILNSYSFGQSLNEDDFYDVFYLLHINRSTEVDDSVENEEREESIDEENTPDIYIEDIRIAKVQFNTKCFELVYSDSTTRYISYILIINHHNYNPRRLFNLASRNAILGDMNAVKREYFKDNAVNGFVKCQETNELAKWEELAVDHRQPNTFSMIVDRFIEVKNIDIENIEYVTNENNFFMFKDENLTKDFINYHKEKANLRIVRKQRNLSRSGMARLKRSNKDLIIK